MDKEFLLKLYTKQSKIIYLYLLKRGCNKQDAEDIVQESFAKVIEYIESLEKEQISSWLFRVAINDYKNRIKKKVNQNTISLDEVKFINLLNKEEDMLDKLMIQEKGRAIRDCLSELNETMGELLILKYEMALSYEEISILLGVKEEHIKTYLYRARERFKKKWREYDE